MSNHGQVVILKILNGVQNGAEVALEDGEYVIGSDVEDDLQITDVALKPAHAKLRIVDGTISIAAGAGALVTSTGLSIEAGNPVWHDIDQLEVVTIATTRFAVAKASANWNSLLSSTSVNAPAPPPQAPVSGYDRSIIRYGLPVLLLLFVLGSGAFALSGAGTTLTGLVSNNVGPDLTVVRTAISGFPFAEGVVVSEDVDGTIYARGYVDSLVERRAISDAVRDTGIPVRLRLWARDVVTNEVSSLIEARGLPLTAVVEQDGTAVLKGTLLDKARVDEVAKLISEQVLGVSAVRSEVRTAQYFLDETLSLAARSRVADGVIFRLTDMADGNQLIEATGAVRNDQLDAWLGFLKSYAASIADTLALRSYVEIEGRTIVVNQGGQGQQPQTANADVMPIIVGKEELVPTTAGRSIPLELLLSDQTSYDALVDAVAPGGSSNADASGAGQPPQAVAADTAEPVPPAPATAQAASGQDEGNDAAADARRVLDDLSLENVLLQASQRLNTLDDAPRDPTADPAAGPTSGPAGADRGVDVASSSPAQPYAPDASGQGAGNAVAGAGQSPLATPFNGLLEGEGPLSPQADTTETEAGPAAAPDLRAQLDAPEASGQDGGNAAEDTAQLPEGSPINSAIGAEEASAEDPGRDEPASTLFDEAQTAEAFRELNQATRTMLDLKEKDGLKQSLGEERGADLEQAFDRISRRVSEVAAVPLPAERLVELGSRACWEGSQLSIDMLPTLVFWLDLLSVSDQIVMSDLVDTKRRMVLEAGLSPNRVLNCLEQTGNPAMQALARGSIYLSEARRNPKFIQFLLRDDERIDLDIVGAKTSGERYVQLEGGETLTEGASVDIESRIASIGELGVLVRVPKGYRARVYPDSMPWQMN